VIQGVPAADLINGMKEPILLLDRELLIVHLNHKACELLDRSEAELVGQVVENFVSHRKLFLSAVLDPFRQESEHPPTEVSIHIGSQEKTALLTASFIAHDEVSWMLRLEDNSLLKAEQRKQAERQIELFKNSRLESIGTLAGGIAHEINNPLAIIMGYTQKLARLASDPQAVLPHTKIAEISEKIQKTALRIGKIVGSLRMLSRDGEEETFETIHLRDPIEGTLQIFRSRAQSEGIDLQIDVQQESLEIRAKPSQISQMCVYLLTNAIEAATRSQGAKWIRVEIRARAETQELAIVDSGPGVAPEIRDQIMLPFFTTKDPGKGTGLGLSIALRIVKEHGGRLWLDTSSPATRFVVEFPKEIQSVKLRPFHEVK
jgi:signal transduction histidine kinase